MYETNAESSIFGRKKEKKEKKKNHISCLNGTEATFLHLVNWQLMEQVEHIG